MLWKKSIVAATCIFMLMMLVGTGAQPAYAPCAPCWCSTLMGNTTISGLIKAGESQRICFLGMGAWLNGVTEVCVYALWRIHSQGEDMQAYIELANYGNGVYRMEIYHSWESTESKPVPTVTMPYSYTVLKRTPYLLVLNITANIECCG